MARCPQLSMALTILITKGVDLIIWNFIWNIEWCFKSFYRAWSIEYTCSKYKSRLSLTIKITSKLFKKINCQKFVPEKCTTVVKQDFYNLTNCFAKIDQARMLIRPCGLKSFFYILFIYKSFYIYIFIKNIYFYAICSKHFDTVM